MGSGNWRYVQETGIHIGEVYHLLLMSVPTQGGDPAPEASWKSKKPLGLLSGSHAFADLGFSTPVLVEPAPCGHPFYASASQHPPCSDEGHRIAVILDLLESVTADQLWSFFEHHGPYAIDFLSMTLGQRMKIRFDDRRDRVLLCLTALWIGGQAIEHLHGLYEGDRLGGGFRGVGFREETRRCAEHVFARRRIRNGLACFPHSNAAADDDGLCYPDGSKEEGWPRYDAWTFGTFENYSDYWDLHNYGHILGRDA